MYHHIACKFYNPVKPKATNYGHLVPKIWNILPVEIKKCYIVTGIKTWIPCRICATYILSLGFI